MNTIPSISTPHKGSKLMTAIRGVVALLFGLFLVSRPGTTLSLLLYLFAGFALVEGIITVFFSFEQSKAFKYRTALFIEGLVGAAIGVLAIVRNDIHTVIFLIAIWAIVTGATEILAALSLGWHMLSKEWNSIIAALLSVILGFMLFFLPVFGYFILLIIGIFAILYGVLQFLRLIA